MPAGGPSRLPLTAFALSGVAICLRLYGSLFCARYSLEKLVTSVAFFLGKSCGDRFVAVNLLLEMAEEYARW